MAIIRRLAQFEKDLNLSEKNGLICPLGAGVAGMRVVPFIAIINIYFTNERAFSMKSFRSCGADIKGKVVKNPTR
jgi:hypothetical protein